MNAERPDPGDGFCPVTANCINKIKRAAPLKPVVGGGARAISRVRYLRHAGERRPPFCCRPTVTTTTAGRRGRDVTPPGIIKPVPDPRTVLLIFYTNARLSIMRYIILYRVRRIFIYVSVCIGARAARTYKYTAVVLRGSAAVVKRMGFTGPPGRNDGPRLKGIIS